MSTDAISKHKYRHLMARDAEIKKLRETSKTLYPEIAGESQGLKRSKSAGVIPQGTQPEPVSSTGVRSLSVKLPRENDNDSSDDEDPDRPQKSRDGFNTNGRKSIGFADSDSDSEVNDSDPFGGVQRQSRSRQQSRPAGNGWLETPVRPASQPAGGQQKSKLDQLMNRLRLEKFPPHWYTTVVEANDAQEMSRKKGGTRPCLTHLSVPMFPRKGKGKNRRPKTSTGGRESEMSVRSSAGRRQNSSSAAPQRENQTEGGSPRLKTRRQLQQFAASPTRRTGVELQLSLNRERSRVIQNKVDDFIRTMEDIEKAKRLKMGILGQL